MLVFNYNSLIIRDSDLNTLCMIFFLCFLSSQIYTVLPVYATLLISYLYVLYSHNKITYTCDLINHSFTHYVPINLYQYILKIFH